MCVVISNGRTLNDSKIKFEFLPDQSSGVRVWLVRLPALRNPDAFPHPLAPDLWELRLEAIAETQPVQILNYTPATAKQWLAEASHQRNSAPTELLILASQGRFTVAIHQSSN